MPKTGYSYPPHTWPPPKHSVVGPAHAAFETAGVLSHLAPATSGSPVYVSTCRYNQTSCFLDKVRLPRELYQQQALFFNDVVYIHMFPSSAAPQAFLKEFQSMQANMSRMGKQMADGDPNAAAGKATPFDGLSGPATAPGEAPSMNRRAFLFSFFAPVRLLFETAQLS